MPDDQPDRAEPFATMAERIRHNEASDFGGAFVIVAPDGTMRRTLLLDNAQEPALFWGQLKTTVDLALGDLQRQAQQQAGGWGGRR